MTTLAEVNASLGVTNIALSDVVKEQKETNKLLKKMVNKDNNVMTGVQ